MRGLIRSTAIAAGAMVVLLGAAAGLLASAAPAVAAASPTLNTTPSPAELTLTPGPPNLKDSAALAGGSSPTGTITFTLFVNGGSTPIDTETVTVDGNGTYTTPVGFTLPTTTTVTGTYQWDAAYSGDANNTAASDTGNPAEQVVVSPAKPDLTTTPSPAQVTLGSAPAPKLKDMAVLTLGYHETGTITFTLFVNGGSTPIDTETVTVNGNGIYTTPFGFTLPTTGPVTGTYQWDAAYSGDANNTAASDTGNPAEQVVVHPANPALTTTPSPATVTLGSATAPTLKDSAVLAGGSSPTGTITFTLFVNGGSTPVDTETVTVAGNGTYTTPSGFSLPTTGAVTGTYQWDAAYSGDAKNNAVSDTGDPGEQVVVTKTSPAISTKPGRTVVTGSALSDSANLTSGASPTGTITFSLYDAHGHVVYTDHVTVSGNGSYSTAAGDHPGGFVAAAAGTYQWVAAYSGDSSNKAISTRKGDEPETAEYGFSGFLSPRPKSSLKSGSTINVKFRLANAAGQPIAPAVAAELAAAHHVTARLTGPGISRRSASCTWNRAHRFFQCKIKTPKGIRTGRANRYLITALENVGAGSVHAPAVQSATTPNPETVFFKKPGR